MNGNHARGTQRHPIRLTAVGAILVGILTTTAPVSSSPGDVVEDWIEQRRLAELAAAMPAGWPATEVMRRAAVEPLGEPADRDRWRRDAELMPSEWPASEAMRQAASAATRAVAVAAFAPRFQSEPNAVQRDDVERDRW